MEDFKESLKDVFEQGKNEGFNTVINLSDKEIKQMRKCEDDDLCDDIESQIYDNFMEGNHQSSEWVNNIIPDFRSKAGCKDPMNVNTFTDCTDEDMGRVDDLEEQYNDGISEGIKEGLKKLKIN
ncbi:MAG: hypothetical protein WC934_06820 [Acidithiobacillus sp.]|uniref:hypothetical protein n=1 Tax=Acidithiobacillus sp. TaxID=1872118 RepID=UPI00355FDD5F